MFSKTQILTSFLNSFSLGRSFDVVKDAKNRSQSYLTFALLTKYGLMFNIVRNLGVEFKLLKECVLKEITKIFYDTSRLLDIPEFQTQITTLELKSLSTMYKTEIVSLSKKQLPVHKAEVKDDTKSSGSAQSFGEVERRIQKEKVIQQKG